MNCIELLSCFKDKYKKFDNYELLLSYVHFEENAITSGLNPGGAPRIINRNNVFYVESYHKDKGKAYTSIDKAMDNFLTLLYDNVIHPDKWNNKRDYAIFEAVNDMVFVSDKKSVFTSPELFIEKHNLEDMERELLAEHRYVSLKEMGHAYDHKLYKSSNNDAIYYYELDSESSRGESSGHPYNKNLSWVVLKMSFAKIIKNDIDIFRLTGAIEHS